MPKTPDRVPDPSQGPVCRGCGFWWPVVAASASRLDHAEHGVQHFEWEAGRTGVPAREGLDAYRRLLPLLRAAYEERSKRLNRQVVDMELAVADLEFDLQVAHDLAADLRAELDAVLEDRHA